MQHYRGSSVGFPGGASGKEPARRCRGARSIPGTGRSSGGGPHSAVSLEKPVAARPRGQGDRGLDTRPQSRGTEGRTRRQRLGDAVGPSAVPQSGPVTHAHASVPFQSRLPLRLLIPRATRGSP